MTETVDILEFVDEVRTRVPLAGEPDMLASVRDAARVLCRKALLWRTTRELQVGPAGRAIWQDPEARIERIETARVGGRALEMRTPDWLDHHHPSWQDTPQPTAQARYVTQMTSGAIMLWPPESATVRLRMVLIPSRDCQTLPRFLLDDHAETLGIGAAARLLLLPNPEFGNPQYAATLEQLFQDEVNRLATTTARAQITAPRRGRASWF